MSITSIITVPFSFILRTLTQVLDSYGLALIGFALIVALIRLPFDARSKRSTMKQTMLQPKIKAIQEKYASNQQKQQQEIQKLYQEEDVKPMSGCIWMLIPLVIMLILYSIIRQPLTHLMSLDETEIAALRTAIEGLGFQLSESGTYVQVEMARYIRPYFEELSAAVPGIYDLNLNFFSLDLSSTPNWRFFMDDGWTAQDVGLFALPIISVILSYISQRVTTVTNYMQQDQAQQQGSMRMMMLLMPLMSLWIGFQFPAALSLYWISNNLFNTISTAVVNQRYKKVYNAMKAEMAEKDRQRELELEAKRKETERLRALNATRENKATSKKKKQAQEREKARQRRAAMKAKEDKRREEEKENPSRVGHRKYARGRAYDPDRFTRTDGVTGGNLDVGDEGFDNRDDLYDEPAMTDDGYADESQAAIEAHTGGDYDDGYDDSGDDGDYADYDDDEADDGEYDDLDEEQDEED